MGSNIPLLKSLFATHPVVPPVIEQRLGYIAGTLYLGLLGSALAGMALSHAIARGVFGGLAFRRAVFEITRKASGKDAKARKCGPVHHAVHPPSTSRFVDVPIVHFAVDWWRSLHQDATLKRADVTIEGLMLFTLAVSFVAMGLVLNVHMRRLG